MARLIISYSHFAPVSDVVFRAFNPIQSIREQIEPFRMMLTRNSVLDPAPPKIIEESPHAFRILFP